MRFNAAFASALASSATLLGYVHAQESEEAKADIEAERPPFFPTDIKAPFVEQFTEGWEERWIPSHAKKADSKSEEDWAYVGTWSVEEPTVFPGLKGDTGLVVKNAAAHHAISAIFPAKIDNKDNTLVVQYEVKPQSKFFSFFFCPFAKVS